MLLDRFATQYDLTLLHAVLCWAGIVMALWCHQLWGRGIINLVDCVTIRGLHRMSYVMLALSLCWSVSYAASTHWQPWPSYVLTVLAVDMYLLAQVLTSVVRGRPFG
jgi:hypothetical protein